MLVVLLVSESGWYKKGRQYNFLLVRGARKENKVGGRLRQEQKHGARFGGRLGSGVTKPPLQGAGSPTTVPGQPAALDHRASGRDPEVK